MRKKYKVLVYGNPNFGNLEADSLIDVLRNVIPYLNKKFDIQFHLLLPDNVKSLEFQNVEIRKYKLPNGYNQMRTHFDVNQFLNVVDNDYDIIYSHLPEHTLQIKKCFKNNPKIIGYSHWFEVPENTDYDNEEDYGRALFQFIVGILEMEECGVNSDWLKQKFISNASKFCNGDVIAKLQRIVQPHYLGIEEIRIRKSSQKKYVIFNHRGEGYTGYKWFIKIVDEIWKDRKDFKVYTTLTDFRKEWNEAVEIENRDEYKEFLSTMKFGVGTFQTYSAWSLSTTDGFSVGVPYLLPNGLCYAEMVGNAYPYLYEMNDKKDFKKMFNEMLDTPNHYDTIKLVENMLWENRISKWFNGWDTIFN